MAAIVKWTQSEVGKTNEAMWVNVKGGQIAIQKNNHSSYSENPWMVTVAVGRKTTRKFFTSKKDAVTAAEMMFR